MVTAAFGVSGSVAAADPAIGDTAKGTIVWHGAIDGVIAGEGFTLTGLGKAPLPTKAAVNVTEGELAGTYHMESARAVTIEAHTCTECGTDTAVVGELVGNDVNWSLGEVMVTSPASTFTPANLTFTLESGTAPAAEIAGDATGTVEGDNTATLAFKTDDVAGLNPGDELFISAGIVAEIAAVSVGE